MSKMLAVAVWAAAFAIFARASDTIPSLGAQRQALAFEDACAAAADGGACALNALHVHTVRLPAAVSAASAARAGAPAEASSRAAPQPMSGPDLERVKSCVAEYADKLDEVQEDLGQHIRQHPLTTVAVSDRELIIGAGPGTTATHGLMNWLNILGLNVWHYFGSTPQDMSKTGNKMLPEAVRKAERPITHKLLNILSNMTEDRCRQALREFDFTDVPEDVHGVMDSPFPELLLDMYLSFPKARVVLTKRNAQDWLRERIAHHTTPTTKLTIQEPCGRGQLNFVKRHGELSLPNRTYLGAYELHFDFVRCLVPREQLFELNLFDYPGGFEDEFGMAESLAKFVRNGAKMPDRALATKRNELLQNPHMLTAPGAFEPFMHDFH